MESGGSGRVAQPPRKPLLPIPQLWEVARADLPCSRDGHFPDAAWPILNKNAIMNKALCRVKHSSAPNIHCIKTFTNPLGSHLWPHFTRKERSETQSLPGFKSKHLTAKFSPKHYPVELLAPRKMLTNVFKSSPNTLIETGVLRIKK